MKGEYSMKEKKFTSTQVWLSYGTEDGVVVPLTKVQSAILWSVLGFGFDKDGNVIHATDKELLKRMKK